MNKSFAKALQDIMMLEEQYAPKKESVELDEAINRGNEAFWKEIHTELKKVMDNKYYREFRSANGGQALDNVISHFGKARGWRVDRVVKEIIDKYGRNRDEYIKLSFAMAARSKIREDVDDEQTNDQLVREYLESYFGGELNESTSDDDIMEAFDDLLETADAVREFMEIQEIASAVGLLRSKAAKRLGRGLKNTVQTTGRALVSPRAKKIYKGAANTALDTTAAAAKGAADAVRTGYNSARKNTGV